MRKGTATRGRIVERAFTVATVEGLDGVTIGRLAHDVGMSKSGLFAHFRSKEDLDLAVLQAAVDKFVAIVARPAFEAPRGEPRVRALFERWLVWEHHKDLPGGCPFIQLGAALDDRPGPARDALAAAQRRWLETVAKAARLAIEAGHFRPALDVDLFAAQFQSVILAYSYLHRIVRDRRAGRFARATLDALLESARAPRAPRAPRARARSAVGRSRRSRT